MTVPEFVGRIRAIAFDAGNTLLWLDHARLARIVTAAGFSVTEGAVREAEMRARPQLDPLLGKAPKRETPGLFRRHAQFALDNLGVLDEVVAARALGGIAAAWPELWCRPPEDARATLLALRARGYAVTCISNSNGKVSEALAAAGLLALLGDVVDSGAVGVEKPDPRIFEIAAERLGLTPAEIVYVGDLHALDVVGPQRAGMPAILLDPLGVWADCAAPRIRTLTDLLPWFRGTAATNGLERN